MPDLMPVQGDPFASAGPQLQPVAHDPFDPEGTGPANYDRNAAPLMGDAGPALRAAVASAVSGHAGDDLVSWLGSNLPQTDSRAAAYGMAAAAMPAVMGARMLDGYTDAARWAGDVQAGRYGTDVTDPRSAAAIVPGAVGTALAMGAPGMAMAEEGAIGAAGGKLLADGTVIPGGRRLTVPAYGERMTRDKVQAELDYYDKILPDIRSDPDKQGSLKYYEAIHKDLQDTLPKFDQAPSGVVGRPYSPAVVDASGNSIVSALTDPRHGVADGSLDFRAYQNTGGYTTDSPPTRADLRNQTSIGSTTLQQHPDGRWEVGMVEVDPAFQRQGVASDMYSAIERHTGQPMIPSGTLLPDGYAMWQKRNPDLVRNYYDAGGQFYSPQRLKDLAKTQGGRFQEAFDALPEDAKTPEALRQTFVGGLPGGAAVAPQPDDSGLLTQFLRQGGGA